MAVKSTSSPPLWSLGSHIPEFSLSMDSLVSLSARAGSGELNPLLPNLSIGYVIPFVGQLLSIALGPLINAHFWEHWYPVFSALWALSFPNFEHFSDGILFALWEVLHALIADYIPFIMLITSLYTAAGGLVVRGALSGQPGVNAVLLFTGTILASVFGTTGASMVMIRPILRSIAHRKYRVHTVVFFIFLVSNIGGCLTPIGDPPVFLGFLRGVDFFWPLINTIFPFLFTGGVVLITYFCIDVYLWRRERRQMMAESGDMEGGEMEHRAKKDEKTMIAGVGTSSIAKARTVNGEVVDEGQLAKGTPSEAKSPVLPTSPPPTSEADSLGNGVAMNSVPTTLTEWPTLVSNDSSDGPLLHNSPAGANGGAGDAHDQNNLTNRIAHALEEEIHDIAHVLEEELVVIEEEVKQIEALRVAGLFNFALLLVIIAAVVASGYIKKAFPDAYFTVWVNPNDGEI
ncbi:hypothetical protein HDU93_008574, partial [Gonapodya sp. JEL0774]